MNIFFKNYSNDVLTAKSEEEWYAFGLRQFYKLLEEFGIHLGDRLQLQLEEALQYEGIEKNVIVVEQGERNKNIYYIIDGSFKETVHTAGLTTSIVNLYNAGNICTVPQASFQGKEADCNLITCERSRVLKLVYEDFLDSLQPNKKRYFRFQIQYFYGLLTNLFQKNTSLLGLKNEEKLKYLKENYTDIFQNFRQKDIAAFANMKAETIRSNLAN